MLQVEQTVNRIREERSPSFWRGVFAHPSVAPAAMGHEIDCDALMAQPHITPLAGENGGLLFCRMDPLGRIYELHAAFTNPGQGEAGEVLKHGLLTLEPDVVLVTETANPFSKPPLSFGFRVASEWRDGPLGQARTWVLTRDAWLSSPVYRRLH